MISILALKRSSFQSKYHKSFVFGAILKKEKQCVINFPYLARFFCFSLLFFRKTGKWHQQFAWSTQKQKKSSCSPLFPSEHIKKILW